MYDARAFCFRSVFQAHVYSNTHMLDLVYPVRKLWTVDHDRAIDCSCVAARLAKGVILFLLSDMPMHEWGAKKTYA